MDMVDKGYFAIPDTCWVIEFEDGEKTECLSDVKPDPEEFARDFNSYNDTDKAVARIYRKEDN